MTADFDQAKFALEAATGGKNTLLMDDTGMPSVMVRIPMFRWSEVIEGGEDAPCSAFVVGGKVLDCIYISKYLNVIINGRAYSLPGRDPAHTVSIDEARAACAAKGRGWHLMTNAEWCAVAHWCVKNTTVPHGNSNFGRYHAQTHEHGVLAVQRRGEGPEDEMRTLTGSGPDTWNHDFTAAGIADLNGNVWDYVAGLRVVDGEIQIIPDNDSAMNVDESETSPLWRAILPDGTLVKPGTPGTLKYDGVSPGLAEPDDRRIDGGFRLNTEVVYPAYTGPEPDTSHRAYGMMRFFDMQAAEGVKVPMILQELGLFPRQDGYRDEAYFFLRNYGIRYAARGGSWFDKAGGGIWDLYLRETSAFRYPDIGFRAAYADY